MLALLKISNNIRDVVCTVFGSTALEFLWRMRPFKSPIFEALYLFT